jgi:hypothetical protein
LLKNIHEMCGLYTLLPDQARKMFEGTIIGFFGIDRKTTSRQFPASEMVLKALAAVAFA